MTKNVEKILQKYNFRPKLKTRLKYFKFQIEAQEYKS